LHTKIDGSIGYDLLRDSVLVIDYPASKVTIMKPDAVLSMTDVAIIPLALARGWAAVDARLAIQGCEYPRYVPVGNDPEITLDTQTGVLCRTYERTNETINTALDKLLCEVTQEQKKKGFVPEGCKNGNTWVKSESGKSSSRWSRLPPCGGRRVIDPTKPDDAGDKTASDKPQE
jgi:hypothetical protein